MLQGFQNQVHQCKLMTFSYFDAKSKHLSNTGYRHFDPRSCFFSFSIILLIFSTRCKAKPPICSLKYTEVNLPALYFAVSMSKSAPSFERKYIALFCITGSNCDMPMRAGKAFSADFDAIRRESRRTLNIALNPKSLQRRIACASASSSESLLIPTCTTRK